MSSELLYHFEFPLRILKSFGFWNSKTNPRLNRACAFKLKFFCMELQCIFVLIHILKSEKLNDEAFNLFFIYVGPICKVVHHFFRLVSIEKLYIELQELVEFTKLAEKSCDKISMKKDAKFLSRLFVFYIGSLTVSIVSDLAVPFFDGSLPYPMWIPYDYNYNELVFWTTSIYQTSSAVIGSVLFVSVELFAVFFMAAAGSILKELSERMKTLIKNNNEVENIYFELIKCVEIHLKIKKFVKNIENCYSVVFIVHGLLSSACICMSAFTLSTVSQFSSILVFHLFFFRFHLSTSFQCLPAMRLSSCHYFSTFICPRTTEIKLLLIRKTFRQVCLIFFK